MTKSKFSGTWNKSTQPRKQRKYRYNAPLHIKHSMAGTHLSKDLRAKYNKRSITIRKGDSVKIMRGEFKGKTGKIDQLDSKKTRVVIVGIERSKKDGTKTKFSFDPSNLIITELNLNDKERVKSLQRK